MGNKHESRYPIVHRIRISPIREKRSSEVIDSKPKKMRDLKNPFCCGRLCV